MPEEIGITLKLYDKLSPTLVSIGNKTKAFDKDIQELQQSCEAYDKSQAVLVKNSAALKTAMVASTDKVKAAKKEYLLYKDELHKNVLDNAIREQEEYSIKLKDTAGAMTANRKAVMGLQEQFRKANNGGGKSQNGLNSLGGGFLAGFAANGMSQMAQGMAENVANTLVGSMGGSEVATLFSSALSTGISGATAGLMVGAQIGTIGGPAGAAIGAAVGAGIGLVSGAVQNFQKEDEAFKAYTNDQYGTIKERRSTELSGGIAIAGKRETDATSFTNALGSEAAAKAYLEDLKTMANSTPFLYDDLSTLSKTLLAYGTSKEDIIPTLTAVGDTGAAKGMDTEGIATVAVALGRMQSTDKASLEYMNLLTERGVDALGWLAERDGTSVAGVYDNISKGKYSGKEVANFLVEKMNEEFGGMMDVQSRTFAGRSSTLEGWQQEMQNAEGEGYNDTRNSGIARQNDWFEGEGGRALQEMNGIIGEGKAYQENLKEQYGREAMNALLYGGRTTLYDDEQSAELQANHGEYAALMEQYQTATDEERAVIAAEIEALKGQAESMAENAFNASTGIQEIKDVELEMIAALRENTAALGSGAWGSKYSIEKEQSKGMLGVRMEFAETADEKANAVSGGNNAWRSRAMGQNTIPYDNFPILAHQGERLLTASQARAAPGGVSVQFTGPITVREEADLDKLARKFAAEVRRAALLAVPV